MFHNMSYANPISAPVWNLTQDRRILPTFIPGAPAPAAAIILR